jgi:RNA polymerase sigma-70 factor (ECF subfamily)
VRRYQDVSFRVAFIITGSAEDAEDAAQEGFVRAYRSIDRFRLEAPFRPWLLRIVANAARTRRGRAARRLALPLAEADSSQAIVDTQPTPDVVAIADEQAAELLNTLAMMRPDDQQVISLRYFVDLSEAEMAEVLNCPRGTVKSRLSRALSRLRVALNDTTQAVPRG